MESEPELCFLLIVHQNVREKAYGKLKSYKKTL